MPFDGAGFGDELRRLARQVVNEVVGGMVLAAGGMALRGVVDKSPVDTGRFRGNWQVVRNPDAASPVPGIDPAGEKTIADGLRDLDGLVKADPMAAVSIVNPLPYASALEHGHSKQAPRGMVALTAAEVQAAFGGGG